MVDRRTFLKGIAAGFAVAAVPVRFAVAKARSIYDGITVRFSGGKEHWIEVDAAGHSAKDVYAVVSKLTRTHDPPSEQV